VKTLCVLQVEDTEADVLLLEYAFAEVDIQSTLRSVSSAEAAIDYLLGNGNYSDRESNPTPTLLLLDLKLPGMSGLELLKWIRTESPVPTLPVIMFSSSGQHQDVEDAYSAGANAFVTKPSGIYDLAEFVGGLKVFWLRYTQFPTVLVHPAIRR
jgi:two-component system response regulator